MKKLVINRKEWLNGKYLKATEVSGAMVNLNVNRYCCMGLALRDLFGVKKEQMAHCSYPAQVDVGMDKMDEIITAGFATRPYQDRPRNTELTNDIADINDKYLIDEDVREEELKDRFKSIGIELEFIGELFPNENNESPDSNKGESDLAEVPNN